MHDRQSIGAVPSARPVNLISKFDESDSTPLDFALLAPDERSCFHVLSTAERMINVSPSVSQELWKYHYRNIRVFIIGTQTDTAIAECRRNERGRY